MRSIVELVSRSLREPHVRFLAVFLLFAVQLVSAQEKSKAPVAATPTPTPQILIDPYDDGPLKVQTDLVTLTVTVHDKWQRFVSNLSKKHFTVFEDNVEQEIVFFSDTDAPVSVGIIYDVSGSMSSGQMAMSWRALQRFMATSHPSDDYSVIAFNNKVRLLADRTRDPQVVLNSLSMAKSGGNTALYDAVYLGLDRVQRGAHKKRALIILSDGMDNSSRYSFKEMQRFLKEADVVIYSVGIYSTEFSGHSLLEQLSEATGGKAYTASDGGLDELFERIALELRNQYSIGYVPQNFQPDGKWRRLKVKINPPRGLPKLSVRAREGYYATPVIPDK